jgi:hypothetical protein
MARGSEILKYPADIGFRAFGETPPDLCVNAGDPAAARPGGGSHTGGLKCRIARSSAKIKTWSNRGRRGQPDPGPSR